MSNWTDELKAKVIKAYQDAEPTPETSTEIIKDIAEEFDQSPNGVRMVLVQAQVYVKKEATAGKSDKGSADKPEGTKRVSKESAIAALAKAIEDRGAEVDQEGNVINTTFTDAPKPIVELEEPDPLEIARKVTTPKGVVLSTLNLDQLTAMKDQLDGVEQGKRREKWHEMQSAITLLIDDLEHQQEPTE